MTRSLVVYLRSAWRKLTSMGTALVLLFLLALAAIPGALWPQRAVNPTTVAGYIADNPRVGPWLDRFQVFDVLSSIWFTSNRSEDRRVGNECGSTFRTGRLPK